jgi:hypothetical protein
VDIQGGQRADVDPVLRGAGHPHDHCWQVDGLLQADGAEVSTVGVAVIGSVEIGAGVADQGEPVDGELGARSVVLT